MKRIGRTQQAIITSLASPNASAATVRDLANDWPWLSYSSVYSALDRLGTRSLVDYAGWDSISNARTYKLTEKGWAVARELGRDEDLDTCDNCEADIKELPEGMGLPGQDRWVHSRTGGPECKDEMSGRLLGSSVERRGVAL